MTEVTRGDFLKVLGILTASASAAAGCSPAPQKGHDDE